ncbi:hypothetical protein HNQ05_001318 [Oceanithermus desulfurans]|uniref:Lipoprotein n=1 Tax=Oceanithermus desulfurans TaxID=227924 RepID=A0ABR6P1T6_9DEIN|nr:hypothetical protein [Oceanithermus desulfurans]
MTARFMAYGMAALLVFLAACSQPNLQVPPKREADNAANVNEDTTNSHDLAGMDQIAPGVWLKSTSTDFSISLSPLEFSEASIKLMHDLKREMEPQSMGLTNDPNGNALIEPMSASDRRSVSLMIDKAIMTYNAVKSAKAKGLSIAPMGSIVINESGGGRNLICRSGAFASNTTSAPGAKGSAWVSCVGWFSPDTKSKVFVRAGSDSARDEDSGRARSSAYKVMYLHDSYRSCSSVASAEAWYWIAGWVKIYPASAYASHNGC